MSARRCAAVSSGSSDAASRTAASCSSNHFFGTLMKIVGRTSLKSSRSDGAAVERANTYVAPHHSEPVSSSQRPNVW